MRCARALVVGTVGTALVLAGGPAFAAGGGTNQGTAGIVYNNVTQGGITFTGTCAYFIDASGLTITGQASASGSSITSITCTVRQGAFATSSTSSSTGPAAATTSTGNPPVPGTGFCITMTGRTAAGTNVSVPQFCV